MSNGNRKIERAQGRTRRKLDAEEVMADKYEKYAISKTTALSQNDLDRRTVKNLLVHPKLGEWARRRCRQSLIWLSSVRTRTLARSYRDYFERIRIALLLEDRPKDAETLARIDASRTETKKRAALRKIAYREECATRRPAPWLTGEAKPTAVRPS